MEIPMVDTGNQGGMAFGRDARLRNRWQLNEMRTDGTKMAGRFCVLIVNKTPPDGMRRAAFLISRRYSLKAVERNRARRLFREVFRMIFDSLPPVWMIFVPRQRMKSAGLADVMEDVRTLGGRMKLFEADGESVTVGEP
ncbi:MAG: ribonuclease P protein component [Victivallales bacterium]|nr:ribonuclease P protein component [Victivallales bacterium]